MNQRVFFAVTWALGTTCLLLSAFFWFLFWFSLPAIGAWEFIWLLIAIMYILLGFRNLRRARQLWLHPPVSFEEQLNTVLDKPLPKRRF